MYQAAAEGAVDIVSAYTTEGRLNALKLLPLADPLGAVPNYEAVILIGHRLKKLPQAQELSAVSTLQLQSRRCAG